MLEDANGGEEPIKMKGGPRRGVRGLLTRPLVLTLVLGIILSLVASLATWKWEGEKHAAHFTQEARDLSELLRGAVKQVLTELQGIAAFFSASPEVSRTAFRQFVTPYFSRLHLLYNPSIQALVWVPRVPGEQRRHFEAAARRDSFPGFQFTEKNPQGELVPAGERSEYFPVYFVEPFQGNEKALGYDLASELTRRQALVFSRDSGDPTATGPIRLVHEPSHPKGFLLFWPVYQGEAPPTDPEQRRAALRGFALGVFRVGDLVASCFRDLKGRNLKIYLSDDLAPEGEKFLFGYSLGRGRELTEEGDLRSLVDLKIGLYHESVVDVGNRLWSLLVKPDSEGLPLSQLWPPLGVLATGLGITIFLSAYLLKRQEALAALQKSHQDLEEQVSQRTRDLVQLNLSLEQEISEREQARKALEESEEKYRFLVNQIPAVVFHGFADWSINFFDQKIECLTGYPKEEFDSQKIKWCDLILSEDLDNARRVFLEALKTDKSYVREYRIRKKDGAICWIQARGMIFCDDRGKVDHASGVFFDITDRKLAEDTLRDHLNFLQTLIDTIPSPIFYKNVQGIYLGCNQASSDFLGLPKEEIIGKSVHDIFSKDLADKYSEMDAALFRQPGVQIYDFSMDRADGTRRDVNFHRATYSTTDGTLAGLVAVMTDITERKRAELERLRFSKLESLATLAGGIAHDFNNILTAIIGNISLAMLDLQKEEYLRERLKETERACLQAQTLARQLLTFAKGGAPIKELLSVEKLITESGSLACRGTVVRCEFSFPDNLWAAEADTGQISQVFQNLFINAIQAMPAGGTIKVRGENLEVEAKGDLPLDAKRYVKLSLQDQGIGIPAEYLLRIFDPYFTTKQTGSGLGLATAYSIVKNHQGHIAVESKLGAGTTFYIYLPAADQKISEQPEEKKEVLIGQGKILVMDDEEMVRKILDKMLGRLGYRAMFARNGDEAIDLFTEAQESREKFDALILDLTVPGGMGGKSAMKKLLKIDPQIKAIVSSGYSDDPVMAEFEKYGFSGVIAKPYKISELSKLLNKVLSKGT